MCRMVLRGNGGGRDRHRAEHVFVAFNRVGEIIKPCGGSLWSCKLAFDDECRDESSQPIAVGVRVIGGVKDGDW